MRTTEFLDTATTLIIAAAICLCGNVSGQRMYTLGGTSILQEIDIETRDVRDITAISPSLSDVAFHPDGTLYGVNEHSIYRIDTTSGDASAVASLPASYGWLVGLAIDWQGKFYLSALGGGTDHLLTYQLGSGTLEDLGSVGYSHWDLEFYNGNLYLSAGTTQLDLGYLVQVNFNDIGSSRIVMDFKAQAYGLASFNTPCEGQQLVAPVADSIKYLDPVSETFSTSALTAANYSVSAGATSPTSYLGSLPKFSASLEAVGQIPCDGNGTIDLIARTTSLRPGIQFSLNGTDYQETPEFNDLPIGTYTVTMRDSFGCTFSSDSISYHPFDPQVSIETRPAHCARNNGSIDVALSNNDSLLYSIDGISWQANGNFSQLPGGTYQLVIRNGADCEEIFDVVVDELPNLTHAFNVTPEHCLQEDGQIEIIAHGGQGPYEYSLVALPNQSSPIFDNLHSGTYTVQTSDALGCEVKDLVDVGMTDAPVISDIAVDNAHCGQSDGMITISASGNGALNYWIEGAPASGNTMMDLAQGIYQIQVTDAFGCASDTTVAISSLDGPSIESIATTNDNCFSPAGAIEITATSSTSLLTYSIDGLNFSPQSNFPNISTGTYNVFVRDTFNCESIATAVVEMDPSPEIVDVKLTPATCDETNGKLVIRPNVTAGLEFSIDGVHWGLELAYSGLEPGAYEIALRDANGCRADSSVVIERVEPVRIEEIKLTDASCLGDDGVIEIYPELTQPDIQFSIDGGTFSEQPVFSGLAQGLYTIALRDANGCIDSNIVQVGQAEGVILQSIEVFEAKCGREDGELLLHARNALEIQIADLTYVAGEPIERLAGGTYPIAIVGDKNCRLDTTIKIPEVGCDLFVPNVFSPNGDGVNELLEPQYDPAEVAITSFDIYDRWGNRIFSCTDGCAWDGRMNGEYVPPGVYVYYLRSESRSGVVVNQSGDITVLH